MVYNTRNYRGSRLCPLSGILKTRKRNCEPVVYIMRDPQYLTTLWVSTACYGESFTSNFFAI
jgi:hypothetical protein